MPRNKFALQNALYVFSNLSVMTAKYFVNLQLQYSAALILRILLLFTNFQFPSYTTNIDFKLT